MPSSLSRPDVITVVIGDDPPARLDKALARDLPESVHLSRSQVTRAIREGAVKRGDVVLSAPTARVAAGEVITITLAPPRPADALPEDIALDIRYEDESLIVLDKPAGMVVHPAPGAWEGTLVNALLAHCGPSLRGIGGVERPGIVHRLDKETSGLMVVAKTDQAHHSLSAQFAERSVHRRYMALCHGVPSLSDPRLAGLDIAHFEPGGVLVIDAALGRHRTDRQRQAIDKTHGRHAVTRVGVSEQFGTPPAIALIWCKLETGRTHQIRVHLTAIGHALIGDPVYGKGRKSPQGRLGPQAMASVEAFPRQALHAAELGFNHPVSGELLQFSANPPQDFADLLTCLRS